MGPPPSDDVKIGMFIVPMAVGAAITAMFTTNFGVRESIAAPSPEIYRHLNLFGDVFERVRAEYVEAPDDEALIEKMRLFGEKIILLTAEAFLIVGLLCGQLVFCSIRGVVRFDTTSKSGALDRF